VWLYTPYREKLRQSIFLDAPAIGRLFERKEHLAFGVVVLAWAGAAAYFAAPHARDAVRQELRSIAFRAFLLSACMSVIVAMLGTVVAVFRTF
jgi:hypothetical protein